jgi:hypothetical protein
VLRVSLYCHDKEELQELDDRIRILLSKEVNPTGVDDGSDPASTTFRVRRVPGQPFGETSGWQYTRFGFFDTMSDGLKLMELEEEKEQIKKKTSFQKSRWFTRGWTLQELLAPAALEFYDKYWEPLGTKSSLATAIENVTRMQTRYIRDRGSIEHASIGLRFSWASKRETTRTEDMAYCLLGLVGVNMPLLYGEGRRAFYRLQLELLKHTTEHTIFAWTPKSMITSSSLPLSKTFQLLRLFSQLLRLTGFDNDAISPHHDPRRKKTPATRDNEHSVAHIATAIKEERWLHICHSRS